MAMCGNIMCSVGRVQAIEHSPRRVSDGCTSTITIIAVSLRCQVAEHRSLRFAYCKVMRTSWLKVVNAGSCALSKRISCGRQGPRAA